MASLNLLWCSIRNQEGRIILIDDFWSVLYKIRVSRNIYITKLDFFFKNIDLFKIDF